jgi:hypothetical protein
MPDYRILYSTIATLLLASCSSISVTSKTLNQFDWSSANTYAWSEDSKPSLEALPEVDTQTLNRIIRQQIEKRLSTQDLYPADSTETADLQISYVTAIMDKIDVHETPKYYNQEAIEHRRFDPDHSVHAWSTGTPKVVEYSEGALAIVIKDTQSRKELWQSIAKGIFDADAGPRKRERRIGHAVKKMFNDFPK